MEGRAEFYNVKWRDVPYADSDQRLASRLQYVKTTGRRGDCSVNELEYPNAMAYVKVNVVNKVHCARCHVTSLLQFEQCGGFA